MYAQVSKLGLMGHNSSGKTTLARCLNALLIPESGEILIDGLITHQTENTLSIRKKVGMVFQNVDELKAIGLEVPVEFEILPILLEKGLDVTNLLNENV